MKSSYLARLVTAVGIATLLVSGLSEAEEPAPARIAFNIQPQPVGDALNAFASQSGLQVLFLSKFGKAITARPVQGTLSPEQALQQLLADSGLRYEFINPHTVTIRAAQVEPDAAKKSAAAHDGGQDHPLVLAQATDSQVERTTTSAESEAAPALEEIVVTAEKREESVQSLPIAISAFSGELLTLRGVEGIESLQQLAPSLNVGDRIIATKVTMRGIGSEVGGIFGEAGVGISQDGLALAYQSLSSLDFFDVERVEVLRGPQGTISGRNATAGAIHIHSKRLTMELEGGLKATLGNYS